MNFLSNFTSGNSSILDTILIVTFILSTFIFGLYSYWAYRHLNNYGYSGDKTQTMLYVYIGTALSTILLLCILFIINLLQKYA